jgi:hypothetical protein
MVLTVFEAPRVVTPLGRDVAGYTLTWTETPATVQLRMPHRDEATHYRLFAPKSLLSISASRSNPRPLVCPSPPPPPTPRSRDWRILGLRSGHPDPARRGGLLYIFGSCERALPVLRSTSPPRLPPPFRRASCCAWGWSLRRLAVDHG